MCIRDSTYTSNLLANGAEPKDVQELLGHSDVSTTMNVYAHSTRTVSYTHLAMKRKSNCFVTILFLIYLALLVWIILFKLQFSISDLDKVRSINLIPFHYDKEIGAAFHLTEVLENFLIFVPMGIYLQMLLPRTKLYLSLIHILRISPIASRICNSFLSVISVSYSSVSPLSTSCIY